MRALILHSSQHATHFTSHNVWSSMASTGLLTALVSWLVWSSSPLQAYQSVLTDNVQPQEIIPFDGIVQVDAGDSHTCALTSAGGVKCWGVNDHGQLGNGSRADKNSPVDVVGLESGVAAITASDSHTCALTTVGGVKCWGANDYGQLGDGTAGWDTGKSTPVDVVGLGSGVAAVSAGGSHTCALTTAGGVKCWGNGISVGDGTNEGKSIPVDVVGLGSGITAISAGGSHTCALTTAGGVKCWGWGYVGQLGNGSGGDKNTPVDVVGLGSGVAAISAGREYTCALTTAGGIKCWGHNGSGEVGDGTTEIKYTPVDVVGLAAGMTASAAGIYHTCALTTADGVKCWGSNLYGELGDGTTAGKTTPVDVVGLGNGIVAIAPGNYHTCALTSTGGVKCWGYNDHGQLGIGVWAGEKITPVDVVGLASGAIAISTGGTHTCALTLAGGVKCWGGNLYGQLGDGSMAGKSTPVDVVGLDSGIAAITTGGVHTCALTIAGGVKCWGGSYQVGDGTVGENKSTPVDVVGLGSGVAAVSAGGYHTCALTTAGGVKCWGYNTAGELGDGTIGEGTEKQTPVDVVGLGSGVAAISAGGYTCALTTVGGVKCWGGGQSTPVDVMGLDKGVAAIAAGGSHACVLTTVGGVKCWGYNAQGQLGDGTTVNQTTPVDVMGLGSGVVAIAAGYNQTCALTTAGGAKCWGGNLHGQLGDGTKESKTTPVDVVRLGSGVVAIAGGGDYIASHTCALTTAGGVKCWGYAHYGQLGDGSRWVTTPVDVVQRIEYFSFLPAVQR